MKNTLKIVAFVAVLLLTVMQVFLLSNIHTTLKQNLLSVDDNPYQTLFSNMWLLVLASLLIILFVIFCFVKVWRMLTKVTRENNMKKEHTYAMIHDMKTPLAAINLVAEDLEESLGSADSELATDVKILKEESVHLNKICEMVISVAKLESDKLQFVFEDIFLSDFLPSVCAKFSPKVKVGTKEKRVAFAIDTSVAEVVNADRLYLSEILDNLIDNAVKYSGDEVEIAIRTKLYHPKRLVNMPGIERLHIWPHKKFIEIEIEDNGTGMDEKTKERLFKKFERGENTVEISGHGIGLHYVYQLMKMMGGYVKIVSTQGRGTTVTLGFIED